MTTDVPAIDALIGRTPLVRLTAFETKPGVEIFAKLESRNPGGSIKDRAALAMIRDGEARGLLGHGRTLLDATSGNTGIAYAMLGRAHGFRVRLCVPANVTVERRRWLEAFSADLILTDPMDGSDEAIREAKRLYERDPDAYFYADQYSNDANWRAHFDTTGPEIIDQSGGRVTHFVAGLGTSGTFTGVGRRLREWRTDTRLVSVQPDSPLHALEGLKHMPTAIVPRIYDASLADENLEVASDNAHRLVRQLADTGLLVGPSSGAALAGCLTVAKQIDRGVIVTIFPDAGDRYLSEPFWTTPAARLTSGLEDDIRRHAAAIYPDECCGALIGTRGEITSVLPLDNLSDGEKQRRFLVTPADYQRAEAHAAGQRADLLGFYHSHPDHPAVPSQFDLDHAWPNLSYVIVSVRSGRPEELRSWRLRTDRSAFDEEFALPAISRSPSWQ
jgi:cysteine synthase B